MELPLSTFNSVLTFPYRAVRWMMVARPIRFTRFGTFYILFAIGVGAAAINTGNNLLYLILGMLLGFIIISGFLSDSGLWGIAADWRPVGSCYAGQKASFECAVQKGWFPGVAVTVESRWKGRAPIHSFVPWIPARGTSVVRVEIIPQHRGYLTLESCHYSTRFPFGLFQKSHTGTMNQRWIVYPLVRRLPLNMIERQGNNASPVSSDRLGWGSVPFTLRDYRAGDPLRQVSWKISAKRQRLIVKEMEEEANEGDLFVLKSWPTHLSLETMEEFISFVASLIFTVYECGRPVGLAAPGRLFKPDSSRQHLHSLLDYLALVDPYKKGEPGKTISLPLGAAPMDILSLWTRHGIRKSHAATL